MRTSLPVTVMAVMCATAGLAQPGQQPLYVYASVGDNQWVSDWPPIDSANTVEALFDWLARTYGAKRIYWRGEQDRMWLRHFVARPENPLYYEFWDSWLRHLNEEVGTNELAVAAAKRHGMEIYIFDGFFEHGAQGDAGGCGQFPYQAEDRLRIEHPEWCPVDRWGERVCPGPIELCYPEARQALVERYVYHTTEFGYEGISFYTYVENMGVRYNDEFGFNEPIVAEFKRRYGVDIRTEPFDKEAWYRLRGEYVTQFLRELHAGLQAHGKKLSFTVRPDKPNLPQRWYGTGQDMPGAGMIYLDWERWVAEGIVDEIFVWHGPDPAPLVRRALELAAGKAIEVTFFSSQPFREEWRPLIAAGATPCSLAAPGYSLDALTLEPRSLGTLTSPDWRLRAQTLTDIATQAIKAEAEQVAPLVSDSHVLVRREALRALAALKASGHLPLIEAALGDPEPSVRIAAAKALRALSGPETPVRLLDALLHDTGFQFKQECIETLVALKEVAEPALLNGMRSSSETVREVCVRALGSNGMRESEPAILAAARDRAERVRYFAVASLASVPLARGFPAMLAALDDPSVSVQDCAARMLGEVAPVLSPEHRPEAIAALERAFRRYGDSCTRSDAAWGWRVVGNALLTFGDQGKALLEAMRAQRDDKWLAWTAYLVLYVPQSANAPILCEERDAVETHAKYAPPFPGHRG